MKKEEFRDLIIRANNKLDELEQIDYEELRSQLQNLKLKIKDFDSGGQSLLKANDVLQIGVVGHMNVGKSSFLNALFFEGEPVLPRAATTMTAGLSFLEYSENNSFEVEYYTKEEWAQFEEYARQYEEILNEYKKKNPKAPERVAKNAIEEKLSNIIISAHEMVARCSIAAKRQMLKKKENKSFTNKSELKDILNSYVGIQGEFTQVVKCITIKLNDERLKGIRIVDTPGTSDPVLSREMRTQQALDTCHGVFLLSYGGAFFSSDDQAFVRKTLKNKGIARIIILASKFDATLEQEGFNEKGKDLEETASSLMNGFRERVNDTLGDDGSIEINNIKIDYTSNIEQLIGFMFEMSEDERKALLNTNDEDLSDEMQDKKSLVSTIYNLKEIYSGYFDTDDDIKESCNGISNFDVIHDDYLEGVFRTHKDEIIEEKVDKYFEGQKRGIMRNINDMHGYFSSYRTDLEDADLTKLESTRDTGKSLFLELEQTFRSILHDYQNHLKYDINQMQTSVQLQNVRLLPTTYTTNPVRCKGWLWGHNRPSITYKQVDTYNLKEKCRQNIEQYSTTITKKWEDFFKTRQERLKKDLIQCVFDYMGMIQNSSFNSNTFTNVITQTLSNLLPISVINLNDVVLTYISLTDDLSYKRFTLYDYQTEDYKESQLDNIISGLFSEYEKDLLKSLSNTNVAYERDVKDKINENLESVIAQIGQMSDNFCKELNKSLDKYVENLEKDIQQKKETLENLNKIINKLQEMKTLFN